MHRERVERRMRAVREQGIIRESQEHSLKAIQRRSVPVVNIIPPLLWER